MNLVRLPAEFFENLDAPVLLDIHGDTVLDVRLPGRPPSRFVGPITLRGGVSRPFDKG